MEPFFHLYSGNDPEQLAVLLAQLLQKTPPQDPFAAQEIRIFCPKTVCLKNFELANKFVQKCKKIYYFPP